ncbi:unnamed protein product [Arabis nemorensis]|uniref:Uncharacterized protein n=1 Tax=Arabis nemorensis TaxID=586526 RepID=A0A565BI01_9BRAS|nr:unnamed protein product [Arabis nemorensis]
MGINKVKVETRDIIIHVSGAFTRWNFEMFTRRRPRSELGLYDIQKLKEVSSNSEINQEISIWLSVDAMDFLEKCLENDLKNSVEVHKEETYETMKKKDKDINENLPEVTTNARKDATYCF